MPTTPAAPSPSPTPRGRHRAEAAEAAEPADTAPGSGSDSGPDSGKGSPEAAQCNVEACRRDPEWRGLCSVHRQTHRGLADEKGAR